MNKMNYLLQFIVVCVKKIIVLNKIFKFKANKFIVEYHTEKDEMLKKFLSKISFVICTIHVLF